MDRPEIEAAYKTDFSRLLTLRNNTDMLITTNQNCTFETRPGQGLKLTEQDQVCEPDQNHQPALSESSISFHQKSRKESQRASKIDSFGKGKESEQNIQVEQQESLGGWSNKIWQKRSLRILALIVRFTMALLINSEKFKFTFLRKRQFCAINDKSAFYEFYEEQLYIRGKKKFSYAQLLALGIKKNKIYKNCINAFQYIGYKLLFVIDPSSSPKLIWDLFLLTILLVQMIFVPLKIGFSLELDSIILQFLLIQFPLYIYLVDIALNFLTGFYEHGVLVSDQNQIALQYLKNYFIYDFLSVMPQFISAINDTSTIFEILLLIRLKKLVFLIDSFEEIFNFRQNNQKYIDVARLLIQYIFLAHLIGCIWHYIGILEINYDVQNNWIMSQHIEHEEWYIRYIYSIYWSSITTLTIGYGDITPVSSIEKIFVVIIAVSSSVVFAYTISSIGQIFSQLNENRKNQRYRMSLIKQFISRRNVNKTLQNKVKKFFEYFLQIDNSQDSECDTLIEKLDPTIKVELKIDIYKNYLIKSKFLSNFSDSFLDEVCQLIKERQFTPDEYLFTSDQEINELYFILKGDISLTIDSKSKFRINSFIISRMNEKNEMLCEKYFLTGDKIPFSAKASSFVKVATIDKQLFINLLRKYPDEFEKYIQVKSKVIQQEIIKIQGCELCFQNHKILQCPFVFYQPNIRLVAKRFNVMQQKRHKIERRYSKSHNARSDRVGIQQRLLTYALESNLIPEESINDSAIRKLDIQCLEQTPKAFARSITDSSMNTLLKNNMNNNFQSGGKESQESQELFGRQNSNNTHTAKPSFQVLGSNKMNTLTLIKMNQNKKIELKVPDKIILQDIGEHNSDSEINSPEKVKQLSKQNSFNVNFGPDVLDCITQLKQDYQNTQIKYEIEGFERYKEYQFYYPQYNVDKIIDQVNEKSKLKRLRQSKQIIRRQSRYLTSTVIRRKRSGILLDDV